MRVDFCDLEIGAFAASALLYTHDARKFGPHLLLPLEVVFFHALVIITFATFADALSAERCKLLIDIACDLVVVFVRLVAEPEYNVLETFEAMFALGKFKVIFIDIVHEFDCVIGGLSLAICGHDKDSGTAFREVIKLVEVILFKIAYKGPKPEAGLGLFSNPDGVLFGGTCL
jgi:hypothetical protein